MIITTVKFYLMKPESKFWEGANSASSISEVYNSENL